MNQVSRRLIRFILACLITFAFELFLNHADPNNSLLRKLTEAKIFYWPLTAGPFESQVNFTSVIELSPETTRDNVSSLDACRERVLTGALLKTLSLATIPPKVVVLDKWYGEDTCKHNNDDFGTIKLIEGMNELCKKGAIIVVGRGVEDRALNTPGYKPPYPLEQPMIDFRAFGCSCVRESIVNISHDFRRLPLWWPEIGPVRESYSPPSSMAFAAARAYGANLATQWHENWPLDSGPPYIALLRATQFDGVTVPLRNVTCGSKDPWRGCKNDEIPPDAVCGRPGSWTPCGKDNAPRSLKDVVVFGEVDRNDSFDTVAGRVFGFVLQANYIESLLLNRTIRPVPEFINTFVGLLIFMVLEFVLWYYNFQWRLSLVLSISLLIGVLLLDYIIVNVGGYFPDPTFSLFSILGSRLIEFLRPERLPTRPVSGTARSVDLSLPGNYIDGVPVHLASAANSSITSTTIPATALKAPTLSKIVLAPKPPATKLAAGVEAILTLQGTNLSAGDTQLVGLGDPMVLTTVSSDGTSATLVLTLPANYTDGMPVHLSSSINASFQTLPVNTTGQ